MPCCQDSQAECNNRIDYSNIIIGGERILPFVFELDLDLSVLNPPAGENQRFCYRVTGVGENISTYVSLSHWVLSLCPSITLEQIANVSVTIGDEQQTVIIGENVALFLPPDTDPTTGCPGLKFDFAINKVLDDENSTGLFCFELTTPYPVGSVNVCVKGGQVSSAALAICGPVCTDEDLCRVKASQLVNVCVPVTIRPYAFTGPARTICCGVPTVGDMPCGGVVNGTCTFYVSQQICVEVPINFGSSTTPGETYVDCGSASAGECVCPPVNND
ncbi:MAG TPA: hypothetical protein PLC88_05095 [Syntrophomonas sp.]|nr:hypothetical protein [Syntrophomonas sp.]